MKRFVLAFVATAVVAVTANASAQVWLRDRATTQGPGIRTGDLELHPGVAAEVGYDSNYFNRSPNGTSGYDVVDTAKLRITPSFHISTLTTQRKDGAPAGPPRIAFDAGAALLYTEFLTNTSAAKLGRNREFGVSADASLLIAPGRPIGFNVFEQFTRTAQPSLDPDPSVGLDRDENRVAGELVYTKTGGLLDWRLGYGLGVTYFERALVQTLNNNRHEIYTRGRWKFLPRTALVYDGNFQFVRYTASDAKLPNSNPIRTRIGLVGLVTDRMSLLAMVGWGASFYTNQNDFDSIIGQAELRYFLTGAAPEAGTPAPSLSSIAIGFSRDFANSYFGNFYERNRGYVNVGALFAQRFYLGIDAGVSAVRYANVLSRETGQVIYPAFNDARIDAAVFGEYRVRDWLGFNATAQYLSELSSTKIPTAGAVPAGGQAPQVIDMKFNRFQAFAGVRVFF